MCGITGWVDFGRDLTAGATASDTARTAAAMIATMACRGPDDQGVWTSPHAVLGHRRLAVIDIEGGRQPMTAPATNGPAADGPAADGPAAPAAVLTYSGEVYNFTELRAELAAHGHTFRTRSDTEVVLHAYLRWGDHLAEHLNGMFALAIWDTRTEELLLVRDRLGVKPLYWRRLPGGLAFGSEPKAILAHPAADAVLDADGLRGILGFFKDVGNSPYRDIHELRPGHILRIRRSGITVRRYWQAPTAPHTDDLPTTVAHVRALLEDIVARQLVSDVPLCTLLSGGLDSSIVTALAAAHGPVRSFAVDFAGQAERFVPDPMRATPDTPFVHDLAAHAGTEHADIVVDAARLADPELRATVVRAFDAPAATGDMNASLYLLFRAIRDKSTVALSGESADEVFGGYLWFHDPDAVHADTFPWVAMAAAGDRGGPRGLVPDPALPLDRGLLRMLDVPAHTAEQYRRAVAEVPDVPGDDEHERRMRRVCHLHLTHFLPMLLDRKDRASMAVGLEVRVPFCDHRLVEYVFATPWSMKTHDGREKSLLRGAGRHLLPESIATRRKSPYPAIQDPAYELALLDQVRDLLADPSAPVTPLLDRAALTALTDLPMDAAVGTGFGGRRGTFELVLSLDAWLREQSVRIGL
ncbi:asparagine synthase (glutamine-hydrolyzing) [Actinomadura logoneensis]|uniref:asparagine synthase (glutamine-hydrolyzing) n=1 Tax=Actinomadura logoneensis TaxID=2293572 RepID=A0A372JFA5_9ACTN|nr:asparagine synthase (glutamine-hydrolyzing) [Actinomadura logoneensis]RFU38534.1 asparagine synthase (glutamine-hydrolyzing) [Actinomadura logoneensis]